MLQVLFIINFRIYNQKCSLCLLYNNARNYILLPYLYQGQKYIATFCNSYGNSVIYSSGRPITLHKWRKLELNIIILYPQRHKKTKLRPFCGLKKGHLIPYTHSYQKYVCTYTWVLSVKKNSNLNSIWEKMLVIIHLTEKG